MRTSRDGLELVVLIKLIASIFLPLKTSVPLLLLIDRQTDRWNVLPTPSCKVSRQVQRTTKRKPPGSGEIRVDQQLLQQRVRITML